MDVINKRKTDFFFTSSLKKWSSYISSYNYFIFVLLIYITLRELSSIDKFQSSPSSFQFLFLSLFMFFFCSADLVFFFFYFLYPLISPTSSFVLFSVSHISASIVTRFPFLYHPCCSYSFSLTSSHTLPIILCLQAEITVSHVLFFFSVSENQSFWYDPLIFMDQSVFSHFFSNCSSLLFHCSAPGKTLSKVALISFPNYSVLSCLLPATSGKNLQEFKLIN